MCRHVQVSEHVQGSEIWYAQVRVWPVGCLPTQLLLLVGLWWLERGGLGSRYAGEPLHTGARRALETEPLQLQTCETRALPL